MNSRILLVSWWLRRGGRGLGNVLDLPGHNDNVPRLGQEFVPQTGAGRRRRGILGAGWLPTGGGGDVTPVARQA